MANIFLTSKCNLQCPYCFADEFVNKDNEVISLDNFCKAVEFIKTLKGERVGLIGGEPTLHPNFKEFLQVLINDKTIDDVIIYTNGLEIDKYIDLLLDKKIFLLVNCNSPNDIGEMRFSKLRKNLLLLKEVKQDGFLLGLNLYSKSLDYNYIFDLLNLVCLSSLRFSVAISNGTKENTNNPLMFYREFKPFLFKFFNDCIENKVVPINDCNAIPNCLLDVDEKRILLKLQKLAIDMNMEGKGLNIGNCFPVVDILPDLTAVRCFGLSTELKVPISDFASLDLLKMYFFNKIDIYAKVSHFNDGCEDCRSRLFDKCGICLTYKLKMIQSIKEIAVKGRSVNKAKNI